MTAQLSLVDTDDDRKADRSEVVAEVAAAYAAGQEVSTVELARKYRKSDRWARRIKADAKALLEDFDSAGDEARQDVDTVPPEVVADVAALEVDVALVREDVHEVREEVHGLRSALVGYRAEESPQVSHGRPTQPDGRGIALAVFVTGVLVSIVFNVLAVIDGPTVAMLLAPVWPLALLGSVELAARNVGPSGGLATFVRWTATAAVALASGWISFHHIAGVVSGWGFDPVSAALAPVAVDGAMLLAGMALTARK